MKPGRAASDRNWLRASTWMNLWRGVYVTWRGAPPSAILAATCTRRPRNKVVVLGDSAPWLWRLVQEHFPLANDLFPTWTQHECAGAGHRRFHYQCRTHAAIPLFGRRVCLSGSGIAEATCKTIISTRTKRTGMRWTPHGLDARLPLRTSVLNGSYDSFWLGRSHALIRRASQLFPTPCLESNIDSSPPFCHNLDSEMLPASKIAQQDQRNT